MIFDISPIAYPVQKKFPNFNQTQKWTNHLTPKLVCISYRRKTFLPPPMGFNKSLTKIYDLEKSLVKGGSEFPPKSYFCPLPSSIDYSK